MGKYSKTLRTRVGKYELGRVLGEGAFAKVRLAADVETGAKVAIKILDKDKVFKYQLVERIKREISTMKLVRHPNIVRLYEIMASKSKIYFVLEYVTGGELFNKIASQGKLKENEARKYFQQLISAVDYCHSRGVCHRDLKPENLLLDSCGNLKISDFGLSALPQQLREDGLLHTACGTPNYVAPEVIVHNGYNGAQADLWSCGIILYVLLTGVLPFDHSNIAILYKKIQRAELKFPTYFPPGARGLIAKILNPNPKLRITIPKVLEDSWFNVNYNMPNFIEVNGISLEDVNAVFDESKEVLMKEQQIVKPAFCNAFELISLSKGLDLSGLFENQQHRKHGIYFASKHSAPDIIMKIEETAKPLGFSVKNRGDFKMKLQGVLGEFKGHLSLVTEIFAVAPSLFMVEVRTAGRDTLDSHNFFNNFTRGIKDIIWKDEPDNGS